MDYKKKTLIAAITSAVITAAALFLTISTIIPVIAAIHVNEEDMFIAKIGDYHYRCYKLKDDNDDPVSGVAIAWNEDADSTPSSLTIPETVSYSGAEYTIKGIAKAGFRYCDFESITLPNTIEIIKEEAFAYCQNLEQFKMPYLVEKIEPSTFLDCRALECVKYLDADGNDSLENEKITRIEDHAFDSCVSLKTFTAPTNLVYLGESCFQKCCLLPAFFFPKAIIPAGQSKPTNKITVRSYAFADCSELLSLYFETNMEEIDDYAFVDCSANLTIRYTGTSIPSYKKNNVKQNHWRDRNIASNLTSLIDVIINHAEINTDPLHRCLHYSVVSTPSKLDSAAGDSHCQITIVDSSDGDANGKYAVINAFETPLETVDGCFDVDTGTLTIPETIDGYPVRVIDLLAFACNLDIINVVFSANLKQIRHHAFYKSTNIKHLYFDNCENLKEVSYFAFQDQTFTNTEMEELLLPDCLEFVGDYSFANFVNVNNFHMSTSMRAIADLAFYFMGNNIAPEDANVDLVLPKTLNDADAEKAYFKHQKKGNYSHTNYDRWYAIGKYAFEGAKCLSTAVMQIDDNPDHAGVESTYATSMFSNAFKDCASLLRFKSSGNLKYVGKDAFKGCTSLKEVFLSTTKAEVAEEEYPWCIDEDTGTYGGTLFFGACPELVCYLDGDGAPRLLDSYHKDEEITGGNSFQLGAMWNAETGDSYRNEVQAINNNTFEMQIRSRVPTYTGIDFANDIVYWNPKTKEIVPAPTRPEQYDAGVVSFVKTGTDEYTAARYYFSQGATNNDGSGVDLVDLTAVPGISTTSIHKLKVIGVSAFAKGTTLTGENGNKKRAPGLYFILPESITRIEERAFYRRTPSAEQGNGRFGARIITYRKESNGAILAADGTTEIAYSSPDDFNPIMRAVEYNGSTAIKDVNKRGYCVLPPNLTHLGHDAFYNHIFASIYISSNISFIGHGAFYTHPNTDTIQRATVTTITMASNTNFTTSGGGIYYTGGGTSKKILVYQAADGGTSFTVADDTAAIGLQACANTKYQTITFNSELVTIYGSGFARNTSLTTVNTTPSVRYIGAMENIIGSEWDDDEYSEIWDSSVNEHFDNTDYHDAAYDPRELIETQFGAFYNCTKLVTMDFTTMTKLTKIGWAAFYNCKAMKKMAGNTQYVYKEYKNGSSTTITGRSANNENVLDLSNCTRLRSIDISAFGECNSIKFIHLPDTKQSGDTESNLHIGFDPETPRSKDDKFETYKGSIISDSKSIRILLKETASYASPDFGKAHNAPNHYASNCFGSKGNTIYYYIRVLADIPENSGSAIKYWTRVGGVYYLINNETDAKAFLNANTPDVF